MPCFAAALRDAVRGFQELFCGEARTAQETFALAQRQNWDVIILDISMPGRSGLDILEDLKRSRPRIPSSCLTCIPEQQFARPRAESRPAAGYLTKDSVPDEFKEAISESWRAGAT